MFPSLKSIRECLHCTTETLAAELAEPGSTTPAWNALEWQIAMASSAAHGISPLLSQRCVWDAPGWQDFLSMQREHVWLRHARIAALLEQIDAAAREAGLAMVPLKGSALHAMGLYVPGERPMADIDLLVSEDQADAAARLLQKLDYEESFSHWRHRAFKPLAAEPPKVLGEHRDTPINIELHTRIRERLPTSVVDITEQIYPQKPHSGLNPYPSTGALMSHLLLHAAGNICARNLRMLHLHDIALLAGRMTADDWNTCLDGPFAGSSWWALPPLMLTTRYYHTAIASHLMDRLRPHCPTLLKAASRRQTLTHVSCSGLWLQAFPGIEWSRSAGEAMHYIHNRVRPSKEAAIERSALARTQLWLQDQSWVTAPQKRRMLAWVAHPVPRLDTMYVVRAAMKHSAA